MPNLSISITPAQHEAAWQDVNDLLVGMILRSEERQGNVPAQSVMGGDTGE